MKYKNCGAQLKNDDAFCGECGTEIKSETVQCTECGEFFNKEFGMCPFCGNEKGISDEPTEDILSKLTESNGTDGGVFFPCPKCGNNFDADVGMCFICGYTVSAEEIPSAENFIADTENKNPKNKLSDYLSKMSLNYKKLGIISAVAVFTIIILSLMLFSPKRKGVTFKQIKSDINALSVVEKGVIESKYIPETSYTVDSVDIEKRQTNIEKKEDIVYCNIVMSNGYLRAEYLLRMTYNYYDDGGWIKDGSYIVSADCYPIAAPEKNLFDTKRVKVDGKNFDITDNMISDIVIEEKCDDGNKAYIATLKYEYSDDVFSFTADWPIEFDPDYGWENPDSENFFVTKTEYKLDSSSITKEQTLYLDGWHYTDSDGTAYSISEAYYVDKAKTEDLYSWNCIYIIPIFKCNLQIDKISSQTKTVSGKLVINESDSVSYEFALKNSTLEIPFTTTYDAENGTFTVPAQIEVLNYRLADPYTPFKYTANGETTFIDVKFNIEYELNSESWLIDNSISKFNIGDNVEFSLFNRYMVKLASEERERIKNSYKQY